MYCNKNPLLKNLYLNTKPNKPTMTEAENIDSKTKRSIVQKQIR